MAVRGRGSALQVAERDLDNRSILWHGQQKYIFEGFAYAGSLFCGLPLLEQGGKCVDVEDMSIPRVLEGDGAVAFQLMVVHIDAPACPTSRDTLFCHGNMATFVVATEAIVNAQSAVCEAHGHTRDNLGSCEG